MPASPKSVAQMRTRTGSRKDLLPHERYAKLCRLELETARHQRELQAVQRRERQLVVRVQEIAGEVSRLLQSANVPAKPSSIAPTRSKKSAVRYRY